MRPAGYRWAIIAHDGGGEPLIVCVTGGRSQAAATLLHVAQPSVHHDAELVELTGQVNELLAPYRGQQLADGRHLATIETPDGWMFAWTRNEHEASLAEYLQRHPSAVMATLEDSPDDRIRHALGLAAR